MRRSALRAWFALTVLPGLAGCATGLDGPRRVAGHPVDTSYLAKSQNSRVQFIVLHYTDGGSAKATRGYFDNVRVPVTNQLGRTGTGHQAARTG